MNRLEEIRERWREDCCQADRNGDEQCVYPVKYGEIRAVMAEVSRLTAERDAALRKAEAAESAPQPQTDYICAVRHYDKYDSRYTFALPSQWSALKFDAFEDYQEFQMQLVYLIGEAKKKWDSRRRGICADNTEGGHADEA